MKMPNSPLRVQLNTKVIKMGIRLVVDLEQLRILESQLRGASDEFLHGNRSSRMLDGASGLDLGGKEIWEALTAFSDKLIKSHQTLHVRNQKLADFVSQARDKYAETEGIIEHATRS